VQAGFGDSIATFDTKPKIGTRSYGSAGLCICKKLVGVENIIQS